MRGRGLPGLSFQHPVKNNENHSDHFLILFIYYFFLKFDIKFCCTLFSTVDYRLREILRFYSRWPTVSFVIPFASVQLQLHKSHEGKPHCTHTRYFPLQLAFFQTYLICRAALTCCIVQYRLWACLGDQMFYPGFCTRNIDVSMSGIECKTNKQRNTPTDRHPNKQASKQRNKHTNKHRIKDKTSKQTNKQTSQPASMNACVRTYIYTYMQSRVKQNQ